MLRDSTPINRPRHIYSLSMNESELNFNKDTIIALFSQNNFIDEGTGPPVSIERMLLGMTNENYLCTFMNNKRYVIRLPGKATAKMINRQEEGNNYDKIKDLNISNEVLFFDRKSGVKISPFIADIFSSNGTLQNKIPVVSACLKKLHQSKVKFSNKFCFFDKIDKYENIVFNSSTPLDSLYFNIKQEVVNHYKDFLCDNMLWVPCHNDPVIENFIMGPDFRLYLIDWEYAGMNDLCWDIAAFALENDLNEDDENYLRSCYWDQAPPTSMEIKKIEIFKVCQDLLWYVWAKIKESEGVNLIEYANKRLTRAHDLLNALNYQHSHQMRY